MRLLLDTHVFIWVVRDQRRLSSAAKKALYDPRNELVLSHASIWEMMTKTLSGKLDAIWTPQRIEDECAFLEIDQIW